MNKTLYEHDCKWCTSLGVFESKGTKYDLYHCMQGAIPTVIARYGNSPSEYISGVGFRSAHMMEAENRARILGLPWTPLN